MLLLFRHAIAIAIALTFCAPISVWATQPKVDPDTCSTLRLEQIKFRASGILDDMSKGPQWAKSNLPAERLREIEHYIQLDEQVKFGCRDAKLSPEAERASEAAARLELNSDADPTAPVAHDPPKPGAATKPGAPEKKDAPKKATHKKAKPAEPKAENDKAVASPKTKISQERAAPPPPVIQQPSSSVQAADTSSGASPPYTPDPSLPGFGFGETVVMPHPGQ
ncbi:hypothetical protein [Hyphomicrobium sp. 99]|uniref:hypothetical protein n=1 Tax=Hyphomicrobium sp. 99 TaxID=1163419 RepID=UPI0005F79CB9|nr:hypothetical protein [Hyphomicrobium sp. 99]